MKVCRYALSVPGVGVTIHRHDSMPILERVLRIARGFRASLSVARIGKDPGAEGRLEAAESRPTRRRTKFDSRCQHPEWAGA